MRSDRSPPRSDLRWDPTLDPDVGRYPSTERTVAVEAVCDPCLSAWDRQMVITAATLEEDGAGGA